MMSRRLFFNAMKEDLRHKVWMIVLFSLASFLAVPMVWLLIRSHAQVDWAGGDGYSAREIEREVEQALMFFRYYLMPMGGVIGMIAGLVAGLSGFRYVFHKNRVDTYHSLPIKRGMLYAVCYVDGILAWAVPFLICLLLTLVFAGGYLGRIGGAEAVARMCVLTGASFLVMLAIFFLVYHTVLVAVMMSGNILNTLINLALLGFGLISIYGMGIIYFDFYMETFYTRAFSGDVVVYVSPLFSAMYFLAFVCELGMDAWEPGVMLVINAVVAAVLGAIGWVLYQRRSSELAEQGVRGRTVTAVLRMATGTLAGMGGWMLFLMITDNMGGIVGVAWKAFGAILLSVFVFGVLDVIFHMEFGAFFAHKFQMAVTVAATLVICAAFYWDWFGYDSYLPAKEEIAQIAVFDREFSNRYGRDGEATMEALENMRLQDVEAIYDFLESAVSMESGANGGGVEMEAGAGEGTEERGEEIVHAKVTLKNGRSYYRRYRVPADQEMLWPMFTSREYLENAYLIHDEEVERLAGVVLSREGKRMSVENKELVGALVKAYNQDVLEHTEEMLSGEGTLLVQAWPEGVYERNGGIHWDTYTLNIYSFMERSIEVLKQAGYGEWVEPREASSVSAVRLSLYANLNGTESEEDIIARAVKIYGVEEKWEREREGSGIEPAEGVSTDMSGGEPGEGASKDMAEGEPAEGTSTEMAEEMFGERMDTVSMETIYDVPAQSISPILQITDRAEIEELLSYISYVETDNNSRLRRQHVRVEVVDLQGNAYDCYMEKGVLPTKYIRRFVDAAQVDGVRTY